MNRNEIGAVLLRIILGLIFFVSGFNKFQGGISNTVGYFDSLGIPGFLAYIVASIELVGGVVLILGIGTKIVSVLFAAIMLGAILFARLSLGFTEYRFELALLAIAIYLAIAETSAYSLDRKLFQSQ